MQPGNADLTNSAVGVAHPTQGYNIKVANPNPEGQIWNVLLVIRSPYPCTEPDERGFRP